MATMGSDDSLPDVCRGYVDKLRKATTPMSDDELNDEVENNDSNVNRGTDGGGRGRKPHFRGGESDDSSDDITPGQRPPTWFDNMEEQVDENTRTTIENRRLLGRIDERTAMLMKIFFSIVIAFVITIGGAVVVQVFL